MKKKRVLVPLDGTKNAEAALSVLDEICVPGDEILLLRVEKPDAPGRRGESGGTVIVGHVMGPAGAVSEFVTPDVPVFAETRDQSLQRQVAESLDYLEDLAKPLRKCGFEVDTEVLLDEHPADAIVQFARNERPTLMAMTRRTHTSLHERLVGSVASHIIDADIAPVLFAPAAAR